VYICASQMPTQLVFKFFNSFLSPILTALKKRSAGEELQFCALFSFDSFHVD
jgi:hypothetical protein